MRQNDNLNKSSSGIFTAQANKLCCNASVLLEIVNEGPMGESQK